MKVFVFGHDRYDTMTTSAMLEMDGVDHRVLVSSRKRAELFGRGGRVFAERLQITGVPDGLAYSRNAALELMTVGEWALFLVDDLKHVSELDTYDTEPTTELPITFENSQEYQARFQKRISTRQLLGRAQATIPALESIGAALLGWAGIDNAPYRRKKWGYNVFADGRAWLVKKTHLRFDHQANTIDDLAWTAKNIEAFGTVLVDRWVLPDCRRYGPGGYGNKDERMAQKIRESRFLVDTYPDFIRYKQKPGFPDGAHVALKAGLHHRATKIAAS